MNLRVNFDKNKKASRIKALREFAMKRLTDFFEEKGWKTGKMGYNENRKRSKYCCWNRTYERLKPSSGVLCPRFSIALKPYLWEIETCIQRPSNASGPNVEPYLWEIETYRIQFRMMSYIRVEPYLWEIETSMFTEFFKTFIYYVEPYLWEIETFSLKKKKVALHFFRWTVLMRDWNLPNIRVISGIR